MSMQKKHRSKGRILGAQGLWAKLQVLAQNGYLGQIRLCHLPQRAAELTWRTREEETRRTFFCRPQGAHISCRKHLKLILFLGCLKRRQSVFEGHRRNRRKHWNKPVGITLLRNSSSRVSAPEKKDHSTHLSQNKLLRAAADSDLVSLVEMYFATALPTILFRGNSVSTDIMIIFLLKG